MRAFREKGRDALAESVRAMKIPEALDKLCLLYTSLYDYVENTELPPEMVSSLMKTKNVLELSWDEWMMNIEVEDLSLIHI